MGAKDGPGTVYSWTPPSWMPIFLPWIALALLVIPRQNRSRQVLWLLLPLGFFLLASEGLLAMLRLVGGESSQVDIFQIIMGVAFAQAAIMLLSPFLKSRSRFLTFLGILFTALVFGLGSVAVRVDWRAIGNSAFQVPMIMTSVLCAVVALTLSLTGLCCRRNYHWLRFAAWALLWVVACMAVTVITLCVVESSPGVLQAILIAFLFSGMVFGMILPFLIVSFASPFFRARLIELLAMQTVPPQVAPSAPVAPAPPLAGQSPTDAPNTQPQP